MNVRLVAVIAAAFGALSSGCPRSPIPELGDAAPPPSAAPARLEKPNAAGQEAGAARTGTTRTTEDEARALLDAWVEAQNKGDFSAYEALYAPRFQGVRRSGSSTAKLDRARWMKERERMFKRKTSVQARDVVITPTHDGATLRFVQSWSSESYRDEGTKRVVVSREVKRGGRLLIAREEMLDSTAYPSAAPPSDRFSLALVAGGRTFLVVAPDAIEEWGSGEPALVSNEGPVVTRRAIDAAKLPPDLGAWRGRKVELFGKERGSCEGTVANLALLGRVYPHFGTRARWFDEAGAEGPKPSPLEVAREAWDMSGGESSRALVAEVTVTKGECKGALWGRASVDDKPVLAAPTPADGKVRALALDALRQTKAWKEIQARYEGEKGASDPKRWDEFDARVDALVFTLPSKVIVTLAVRAGPGCAQFGATLGAAWKLEGGRLEALREAEEEPPEALSAGDVDGDGEVDVVLREGLLKSRGRRLEPYRLKVKSLDCDC